MKAVTVLLCQHPTQKWIFDYDSNEIICSVCGKVINIISESIMERDMFLMERLEK